MFVDKPHINGLFLAVKFPFTYIVSVVCLCFPRYVLQKIKKQHAVCTDTPELAMDDLAKVRRFVAVERENELRCYWMLQRTWVKKFWNV